MTVFEWVIIVTAVAGVGGTGLGGVMFSVVCFDLLSEAMNQNIDSPVHILLVAGMTVVGYGIIYLLNVWIDKTSNKEVKQIQCLDIFQVRSV